MIEKNVMPQIVDLGREACYGLLEAVGFGHLGFSADDRPYVVPIHFAVAEPLIYFFTTEGKKTAIIDQNPNVCLQVERIEDSHNWESVIVEGTALMLSEEGESEKAMSLILAKNPTLTPAISIRWMDSWVRESRSVVYKIVPETISGRKTIHIAS
jgi:Predicted flavin-nucleotide-binding protein